MSSRREVCASVCESLAKPTIVYVYEFKSHRAVTDHRDRRALRRRRARRTGLCAVKCDHGCEGANAVVRVHKRARRACADRLDRPSAAIRPSPPFPTLERLRRLRSISLKLRGGRVQPSNSAGSIPTAPTGHFAVLLRLPPVGPMRFGALLLHHARLDRIHRYLNYERLKQLVESDSPRAAFDAALQAEVSAVDAAYKEWRRCVEDVFDEMSSALPSCLVADLRKYAVLNYLVSATSRLAKHMQGKSLRRASCPAARPPPPTRVPSLSRVCHHRRCARSVRKLTSGSARRREPSTRRCSMRPFATRSWARPSTSSSRKC